MGCQCPGETLSPRLAGKDAQSWQPNPACLHTASLLLPAVEITPSLCLPGRWRRYMLGLAAGSSSAGPSLGTHQWVPGPGLQHRGQQTGRELLAPPPHAHVPPSCPDGAGKRGSHVSSPAQTGQSHAACARQPLLQLARPPPGIGHAVPALGRCPWRCLGQRLEDALLAQSPRWRGRWLRRGCGAFGHLPVQRSCCRQCWLQAAVPGQLRCPGLSLPGHRPQHRAGVYSVTPWAWAAAQGWGAQCHHQGIRVCVCACTRRCV